MQKRKNDHKKLETAHFEFIQPWFDIPTAHLVEINKNGIVRIK